MTVGGLLNLTVGGTTNASAGAATLPSNPCGFLTIHYNGDAYRVPAYAPFGQSCP